MGTFRVDQRQAKIEFPEGHDYAGAEITVTLDMPTARFLEVQALAGSEDIEKVAEFFVSTVVEWNLADTNGPLPLTKDGLLRCPPGLLWSLLAEWSEAISGVTGPLGQSVTGGSKMNPAAHSDSRPPMDIPMKISQQNFNKPSSSLASVTDSIVSLPS